MHSRQYVVFLYFSLNFSLLTQEKKKISTIQTSGNMETKTENILSTEQVFRVVSQDLKSTDFEINNFEIKQVGENAVGFLGEHKKLIVDISIPLINQFNKKFYYFVKKTPGEVQTYREYLEKIGCFVKEIGLYKTLFNEFNKVLPDKKLKWRPNYYYSKGNDLFVIEDLSVAGYYMYPERTLLDKEHVMISLKSIAAMHASSLIFERRFNEGKLKLGKKAEVKTDSKVTIWDLYKDLLFETEATADVTHPGNTVHEVSITAEIELIDHLPNYTKEQKALIKEKLPERMRRFFELVKSSDKYKNVVVHGDLWSNNLLYRKNSKGKLQDVVIIDFQMARYAPPAHDLMMFLHLVQNRKFREKYQNDVLLRYHTCLSQILEKEGLDVNTLLPWNEFRSSCAYYEELGILTALFYFQLILAPSEISNKFTSSPEMFFQNQLVNRNDMVLECFQTDSIYRERVTETLNEVIEKFILN